MNELEGRLHDRYDIRPLRLEDAEALADAYVRNREHLAPFEPVRAEPFYTAVGQRDSIAESLEGARQGRVMGWLVHDDAGAVRGRFNLNNIVRGGWRSADLGYWCDKDTVGRGLATAAAIFVADSARTMGLHRLAAGTLVDNVASQRVLAKSGFERYGLAPDYLFVNGAWRDHILFQRILHDDPLE